jgi:hypothetical protein
LERCRFELAARLRRLIGGVNEAVEASAASGETQVKIIDCSITVESAYHAHNRFPWHSLGRPVSEFFRT